jgi:hypothetical protein
VGRVRANVRLMTLVIHVPEDEPAPTDPERLALARQFATNIASSLPAEVDARTFTLKDRQSPGKCARQCNYRVKPLRLARGERNKVPFPSRSRRMASNTHSSFLGRAPLTAEVWFLSVLWCCARMIVSIPFDVIDPARRGANRFRGRAVRVQPGCPWAYF